MHHFPVQSHGLKQMHYKPTHKICKNLINPPSGMDVLIFQLDKNARSILRGLQEGETVAGDENLARVGRGARSKGRAQGRRRGGEWTGGGGGHGRGQWCEGVGQLLSLLRSMKHEIVCCLWTGMSQNKVGNQRNGTKMTQDSLHILECEHNWQPALRCSLNY